MKPSFHILLSLLLTVSGCVFSMQGYEIPNNEKIAGDLLQKISKKLENQHKMRTIGTVLSMPGGLIRSLGLDFQIYQVLTKQEI